MSGPIDRSVTLEDVFTVVNTRRVPLAPELAGYLTLEIAEGAQQQLGEVDPRSVFVGDEGTVALVRTKDAGGDAETSVRAILLRLLEASGSQTPALGAAARRRTGSGLPALVEELEAALIPVNRAAGRRALARLAREVKRVTLGVGRNAPPPERPGPPRPQAHAPAPAAPGRSPDADPFPDLELVLPRGPSANPPANPASIPTTELSREDALAALSQPTPSSTDAVDRLLSSFEVSGATTDRAVSRELKAMVGLEPTPPPPSGPRNGDDVEVLLAMADQSIPIANLRRTTPPLVLEPPPPPPMHTPPQAAPRPPAYVASPTPAPVPRGPSPSMSNAAPPSVPHVRPAGSRDAKTIVVRDHRRRKGARVDRILAFLTVLVLVMGGVAVWMLKPGFLAGRMPDKVEKERQAAAAASLQALATQQQGRCRATLSVSDVPTNAEVLMRVGQAPIDIERMPVGARLEFVATAEGFAPRRSIIPAGAAWDQGPDGKPRFELAVQLDPTRVKAGAVDLWPAGEPGSVVGGKGSPGTVHVVSTPRGAEMWLLVGAGPEATIDPVKCEQDAEILVAGPTTFRKRLKIGAQEIAKAPTGQAGAHVVKMSAK